MELWTTVIGGVFTVTAAVIGALLGRSNWANALIRSRGGPSFAGTKWESSWGDRTVDGDVERKETFHFTHHRKDRVYGTITYPDSPDRVWDIEGIYDGHFLRLMWQPSRAASNQFFLDVGCYFFKPNGLGSFTGVAVGHDSETNQLETSEHTLTQLV